MAGEHDLNLIGAYVEDRLPARERATVVSHLATCAECRAVLAGLLRAAPKTGEAGTAGAVWHGQRRWLPLAATLVIAAAGGWVIYNARTSVPVAPSSMPAPATGPSLAQSPRASEPPRSAAPPAIEGAPTPPQTRAGGDRVVGEKSFQLVAGEWIDRSYDPFALFETRTIRTPNERDEVLEREPALRPYLVLGPRFTVVVGRDVYKFELP